MCIRDRCYWNLLKNQSSFSKLSSGDTHFTQPSSVFSKQKNCKFVVLYSVDGLINDERFVRFGYQQIQFYNICVDLLTKFTNIVKTIVDKLIWHQMSIVMFLISEQISYKCPDYDINFLKSWLLMTVIYNTCLLYTSWYNRYK